MDGLGERLRAAAARDGIGAVGQALIAEVAGPDARPALPQELRDVLTGNGPAILAELAGVWWLEADPAALAAVERQVLLVTAAGSPPALREPAQALDAALPNARTAMVGGDHLIDPAHPAALAFLEQAIG